MNSEATPYLQARWPFFYLLIGVGVVVAVAIGALAVVNGWWAFLPLAALILLLVAYAYAATTWIAQRVYGVRQIADQLWHVARLAPHDDFVFIDIGLRDLPVEISQQMSVGTITIVDVYNPQLMPEPAIGRLRNTATSRILLPLSDPRTIWVDGTINLLPLPDESARVVMLDQTFSVIADPHDRELLLAELWRIVAPGGKLVLTERVAQRENRWVLGWQTGLNSAENWRDLLTSTGFTLHHAQRLNGLLYTFRLDKAIHPPHQLRFDF